MKKYFLSSLFFLVTLLSAFAQVPEKAENVSPLMISQSIPKIEVLSVEGKAVKITDIIKNKPSVLIFYRGGWCPFCNSHLSALGKSQQEILDLGYQIIAISPDAPTQLKETLEEDDLTYSLYSDIKGDLIKAMGIAFEAPKKYKPLLDKISGGKHAKVLPIPGVFVLNKKGVIEFEYVSPDYRNRISSDLLISVLTSLNKEK
jgi:peroxiredoxin